MISKFEIAGVHADLNEDLRKYVEKKIGKLDKYLPKKSRESAHAEVKLKDEKAKNKKQYTCEVILHLPHETITSRESTLNMFAAVDIVEAKLKNQLKTYKNKHSVARIHRKLLAKIRGRQ